MFDCLPALPFMSLRARLAWSQASIWPADAVPMTPGMAAAMWGPAQPGPPIHAGGFQGFVPHGDYSPVNPGLWNPYGGTYHADAQPR